MDTIKKTSSKKEWIKPELNNQLEINNTEANTPNAGLDTGNWAS